MHWNREELFAAGALTLAELIAQVPGTTAFTSGFVLSPQIVGWHGDPGGVRLFLDGVERPELTPRNGGVTDFSLVPLWSLEDVTIEETAGELRVHARTWRVERTTPYTRTDVLTGSENINLFRGFFGKRSTNGVMVQVAAQQLSSLSLPGMDGDGLGAFGRLGWAAGNWSVDVSGIRQGLNRNAGARGLLPFETLEKGALPAYHGAASTAYLRVGWRDANADGIWAQAIAATTNASKTAPQSTSLFGSTTPSSTTTPADTADTTASRTQYAMSAGLNRGAVHLNGTLRAISDSGVLQVEPLIRGEFVTSRVSAGMSAGRRAGGGAVWDGRARIAPFSWFRIAATAGQSQSSGSSATRFSSSIDASVQVAGRWIGGGVIRMGEGAVLGPVELDTAAGRATSPAATGMRFSAYGPVWNGWMIHTDVIEWDAAAVYRPQTEAHSRLWFESSFKELISARSQFHLLAALTHEYRSKLYAPSGGSPLGQEARSFSAFGTLLEIRIAQAVISWNYRNMAGLQYETFPGYLMPRIVNVYGIRWEFWN